ncbi:MAG TPA: EAL domain-containing protein, partial [Clostridiales bacterium]|nr:EAL domain-containing protein [Clostridiales bacterium]
RGFEALIRWNYPAMGLVSPASFIPIAEETGMINEIGRWIISSVLTRFIEFHKSYQSYVVVSINISAVQLAEPSFVPMLQEALEETGFNSSLLELEITESVMISFPEHIIDVLNQLRDLGIRIALDDFGTGYASLSYLQMLPINVLKIDKTFIDKIDRQDSESNIVGYIIYLAHQLGIEVVAEGVETEEQLDYLIEQNCDYVQGYLLSRPLEEDKVIKLLESR